MNIKNNKMEYLEMIQDGQATNWAGSFFYKHLFDVWTQQQEALKDINNYERGDMRRIAAFEYYYDLILMMRDMITPNLEKEDLAKLNEIFNQILQITNGAEFSLIETEVANPLQKIKTLLSHARQLLWQYMFKYGMIMPAKKPSEDNDSILG